MDLNHGVRARAELRVAQVLHDLHWVHLTGLFGRQIEEVRVSRLLLVRRVPRVYSRRLVYAVPVDELGLLDVPRADGSLRRLPQTHAPCLPLVLRAEAETVDRVAR